MINIKDHSKIIKDMVKDNTSLLQDNNNIKETGLII